MPGWKKAGGFTKMEEIPEKGRRRSVKSEEATASPSVNSSLSVLDISLTKQLVAVAETAIRNHLHQQKKAARAPPPPPKADDTDDEIQVIEEKTNPQPKSNQTVLQLGLPKVSK